MSKASRRRQQPGTRPATGTSPAPGTIPAAATSTGTAPSGASAAAPSAAAGSGTTSRTSGQTTRTSQGPGGTSRTGRRPTSRTYRQQQRSFAERYRGLIIAVAALAGVALIGLFVFASASAPAYACSTLFDPAPTASPAAGATPNWGYPQDDMGRSHLAAGTKVTYTYCPPASGKHYNASGSDRSRHGSTARTTRRSRRAGSTTWSTARSCSCTAATARARPRRASSALKDLLGEVADQPDLQVPAGRRGRR